LLPDTAICGEKEKPALLLMLTVGFHVAPLSVLRLNDISDNTSSVFCCVQTTNRFDPDAAPSSEELLSLSCALALLLPSNKTTKEDSSRTMRGYAKTDFAMNAFNIVILAVGI
jgi:hypothetical protein